MLIVFCIGAFRVLFKTSQVVSPIFEYFNNEITNTNTTSHENECSASVTMCSHILLSLVIKQESIKGTRYSVAPNLFFDPW